MTVAIDLVDVMTISKRQFHCRTAEHASIYDKGEVIGFVRDDEGME